MGLLDALRGLVGGSSADSGESGDSGRPNRGSGDAADGAPVTGGSLDSGDDVDSAAGDGDEMGPDRFREESAELLESWGEYDLDYSPESLGRLADLIDAHYGDGHFDDAEFGGEDHVRSLSLTGFTIQFGSYFGEVLRREFGGEWVEDDEGWTFYVESEPAAVEVPVFAIAHEALLQESSLEAAYDRVREQRESVLGHGVAPDVETAAESFAAERPDADLDFSAESLARLDALVDDEWATERFRDAELGGDGEENERYTELVVGRGSYYGEVLTRSLDAEWTHTAEMGVAVSVRGDDESLVANVFHIAEDCLTEPSKFAFQYDVIADQLGLDVPQVSDGEGEVLSVDQDAVADEAESIDPEDVVAGFQDDATDFAESWPDYDLDFSPDSLVRVDDLVRTEFDDFDFADTELGDESDGDSLFLTAHAMDAGAYFAAVMERHLGAEWRADDLALVVEGDEMQAEIDPIGLAGQCFRGEDSFAATYEAIRGQLSVDAPRIED